MNGVEHPRMADTDMSRSPKKAADALPVGWGAERFKVMDGDSGRIGLKSTRFNKRLRDLMTS